MRLPMIHGLIRRRLLINFRVDASVMQRFLPPPFRPKLHAGFAIAGICLIRLEQIRPAGMPALAGISSENAAHRIAVCWDDSSEREGVFIPRRDTSSWLNHFGGGRIFPGEHHLSEFAVEDNGHRIFMAIRARDDGMQITVRAEESETFPASSCFASLAEASRFFEGGSLGYSVTRDCCRLDGLRLQTEDWNVRPLAVEHLESSFFLDTAVFPAGSAEFDHALVMRDLRHQWHQVEDMVLQPTPRPAIHA
ncbi:MAG TPA: DUF2071 domain-containing protein [Chthoniobacter sp.]|jgi:hypothetical protein